jgi:hypothetical protein
MFAQWWRDAKVLSTFILQRFPTRTVAASKSHHCANTNVVGKAVGHQKHDGLDLQRLGFKKAIEINKRLFHERRHWNSKKWLPQTH